MWNTIATFRENLSQIASEVLDSAEELEIEGLQEAAATSNNDRVSHTRFQKSDTPSHHNLNEQSGEQMESVGKIREEHTVSLPVLPKIFTSDLPSKWKYSSLDVDDRSTDDKSGIYFDFNTRLREMELKISTMQAREKELFSQVSSKEQAYRVLREEHDALLEELERVKHELSNERLDASKKNLQFRRQSEALEAAAKKYNLLKEDKYQMSLELAKLHGREDEDVVSKNDTFDADFQSKAVEQIATKDGKLADLQKIVTELQGEKLALQAEREKLLEDLQSWQQGTQMGRVFEDEPCAANLTELELHDLRSQVKQLDTLSSRLKIAEEALALEKLEHQKKIDTVSMERDKAIRDLSRLKQHLLDKELADSEKMDQDNEHIQELESRAATSNARVLQLEQSLSLALVNQDELNKKNVDDLQIARIEVECLNQKVNNLLLNLDSRDAELANLQSALGQYYAEIEAQERLYGELRASKEEIRIHLEELMMANKLIEATRQEKEDVLEKLAHAEQKFLSCQQRIQKLEEDVSRLRHALEQSLTRLNMMSSDSNFYVDRRIVIKLLVTYFQRKHSTEVLDLMARMLGFSEEDKQRVGLAHDNAGKTGVVKSVLGIPGRFVGGLLGSGISNTPYVPTENQSFADLWIDFLLKESEERDRRERAESNMKPVSEISNIGRDPTPLQGSYNYNHEPLSGRENISEQTFHSSVIGQKPSSFPTMPQSPRYVYQNHIGSPGDWQGAENGVVSKTEPGEVPRGEFLTVPLNSSLTRAGFGQKNYVSR